VGGALLVNYSYNSGPPAFATLIGLIWLAVVVSIGVRTASAALVAGLMFGLVPGIFSTYLPTSVGELPSVLFGVGAILVIHNPDGVVAMHAAQLQWLVSKVTRRTPDVDKQPVTAR
jgi:branched-chain amino acid transport system permease protein